jgi:hypothetical protein
VGAGGVVGVAVGAGVDVDVSMIVGVAVGASVLAGEVVGASVEVAGFAVLVATSATLVGDVLGALVGALVGGVVWHAARKIANNPTTSKRFIESLLVQV